MDNGENKGAGTGMKVLLVEDNERVTQFVTRGLREAGHTVDHTGNGRDGLFLAASEPYDVVVLTEAHTVDELGRLIVSKLQLVPRITRTVTCSVVNL